MSDAQALEAREFLSSVESLCGEANEAARLAESLFDGEQKEKVRRALARCMEIVETEVLPAYRGRFEDGRPRGSAGSSRPK
jgi:hypothetical protein